MGKININRTLAQQWSHTHTKGQSSKSLIKIILMANIECVKIYGDGTCFTHVSQCKNHMINTY